MRNTRKIQEINNITTKNREHCSCRRMCRWDEIYFRQHSACFFWCWLMHILYEFNSLQPTFTHIIPFTTCQRPNNLTEPKSELHQRGHSQRNKLDTRDVVYKNLCKIKDEKGAESDEKFPVCETRRTRHSGMTSEEGQLPRSHFSSDKTGWKCIWEWWLLPAEAILFWKLCFFSVHISVISQ